MTEHRARPEHIRPGATIRRRCILTAPGSHADPGHVYTVLHVDGISGNRK